MTTTSVITTDRVRVPQDSIPLGMIAVTWRRAAENVWHYRYHDSVQGAKVVHGRNDRAYDRETYQEWGWKLITTEDRKAGLWLW